MIEEKEFNRYYAIPANYTDSGRLFCVLDCVTIASGKRGTGC